MMNQNEGTTTEWPDALEDAHVRPRPCPFCGGRDIQFKRGHEGITFVMCGTCHAITSFGGRERMRDTRMAWDHRAA